MKKSIFIILISITYLFSNSFNVDDKVYKFSLPNQFNRIIDIDKSIEIFIVSFEKGTSSIINNYLESKEDKFLERNHAVYIANISKMPTFVTKWFAIPKMKSYKYNILLIYSEIDKRFLHKDGNFTIYKLKNGVIKSVDYIDSKTKLDNIFNIK